MLQVKNFQVTLLLPKIEDGSNFGRSVLEEAANEIQEAECQATTYLNQISNYYTNRAKVLSTIYFCRFSRQCDFEAGTPKNFLHEGQSLEKGYFLNEKALLKKRKF